MRKFARILCDKHFVLLKNWRASFYVAKKKMSYAKVCSCAQPDTENLLHTQRSTVASSVLSLLPWSFLPHRQTSFQHSICSLYTRANLCHRKLATENLLVWTRLERIQNTLQLDVILLHPSKQVSNASVTKEIGTQSPPHCNSRLC